MKIKGNPPGPERDRMRKAFAAFLARKGLPASRKYGVARRRKPEASNEKGQR